jgi:hypothetical protein
MTTYWQPVEVPERCFLDEALLWLAFQRLPITFYNNENKEIRSASEYEGPKIETPSGPLTDEECTRAGIPPDPHFHHLVDESPRQTYKDLEPQYGHDEALERIQEAMHKEQADYQRAGAEWQRHYDGATEYAASQIFVALRDGRLPASGRLLPSLNVDEAIASLEAEERYVGDLPRTDIPRAFWSLKGIHFDISAAQNAHAYYCHVMLRTEDLLSVFPGGRHPIAAEQVGETIVLNETAHRTTPPTSRGRPSYPWERFHLEVSALLQGNGLPTKKEAAIQHFQSWFERELGIRPSRAAIGEKLTPYYDRFLRGRGQKI